MYANALFDFIEKSPSAPLALHTVEALLKDAGYQKTEENAASSLGAGKFYFVRGGASVVALSVPEAPARAVIAAARTTCACISTRARTAYGIILS